MKLIYFDIVLNLKVLTNSNFVLKDIYVPFGNCKYYVSIFFKVCMFCCTLLYVHSSIAIILMGKRELVDLLILSTWCPMMVERLFLAVPRG